jgi:O-antigen ligase
MTKLTTAALFFLAAGIFTSVSILSAYQVLIAIPLIYYTYLCLKKKEVKLPISAYWLLAFALIALLSLVLNFELLPKPSKNFGRLKYFLFGISQIFVLRYWLKEASVKTKSFILNTFFVSLMIAGLYAIYTFIAFDRPRAKPLTETMRYGYGSGMILLTVLSALLHREKLKHLLDLRFAIPAFILGFLGMYLTYTRGALLGFICGLPFVLYFYKPKFGKLVGAISLFGVLTLGGIYFFYQGESSSRFLMNKNNPSDVIRRSQWEAAIIATKEKPVLGWGLSNFHSQLKRIKTDYDLDAKNYNDAHSHNLFLEIASGTGMIGFLAFLGWLISWAWEMFMTDSLIRLLVIPFGVAFVASSQFEVTFDANNASMIFFVYSISTLLSKSEASSSVS